MKLFKRFFFLSGFSLLIVGSIFVSINFLESVGFFNLQFSDFQIRNSLEQPNYMKPLVFEVDEIVKTYHGTSLWKLDIEKLASQLLKKKWLQSVTVSRRWPKSIQIYLELKPVKLILMSKENQFYPVTGEGEILSEIKIKNIPDLAVLRGEIFFRNIEIRKKALQMVSELPKNGAFSIGAISEIFYENKEGFFLRMSKGSLRVKIGDDQFALKAARVGKVIEYLEAKSIQAYLVDANLSKKVLVKLKKVNEELKLNIE